MKISGTNMVITRAGMYSKFEIYAKLNIYRKIIVNLLTIITIVLLLIIGFNITAFTDDADYSVFASTGN